MAIPEMVSRAYAFFEVQAKSFFMLVTRYKLLMYSSYCLADISSRTLTVICGTPLFL